MKIDNMPSGIRTIFPGVTVLSNAEIQVVSSNLKKMMCIEVCKVHDSFAMCPIKRL
jgi:hypothetical protein